MLALQPNDCHLRKHYFNNIEDIVALSFLFYYKEVC